MPFKAIDTRTGEIVWAFSQTKDAWLSLKENHSYLKCLACGLPLVPKGYDGGITQYHYAHPNDEDEHECPLRSNSDEGHRETGSFRVLHDCIQRVIYQTLEGDGAVVECKIDVGGDNYRYADVCLPSEKLIFEVQTSRQKDIEERERTDGYRNAGYTTIWVEAYSRGEVTPKHVKSMAHVRNRKLLFKMYGFDKVDTQSWLPVEMRCHHITFNAYQSGKLTGPVIPLKTAVRWIATGRMVLHRHPVKDDVHWEIRIL